MQDALNAPIRADYGILTSPLVELKMKSHCSLHGHCPGIVHFAIALTAYARQRIKPLGLTLCSALDSFYVREAHSGKVLAPERHRSIEHQLRHAIHALDAR
jgi:hypothetical protein